jgi:hypothetical protein
MSEASSSCATCVYSFLGFERHSRIQCPSLPQRQHSSSVGLPDDDPPDEEPSCQRPPPHPRPLPAPPPRAPLSKWFSASRFFLRVSHSSSVRYNFPSCCNDIGASSNASFYRPVRSATDIVDTSSNILIAIVIYLKRGGRDRSIFATISLSFTSSPSVARCVAMPLSRRA